MQERLCRIRASGEAFTTQRELADRIGCSAATIHKAIHDSVLLEGWAGADQGDRGKAWSIRGADDNREGNPANFITEKEVDRIMAILLQEAEDKPVERAELNSLNAEGRRKVALLYRQQQADGQDKTVTINLLTDHNVVKPKP